MSTRQLLRSLTVAASLAAPVPLGGQAVPPAPDWPALAVATFDSVWTRVRDTHFDPELGGADWNGARDRLRPLAGGATSVEELRSVLNELLGLLGESHFTILPASAARAMGAVPPTNPGGDATPGFDVRWIGGEVVVTRVEPTSAADEAGVRPGWSLEQIDGLETSALIDDLGSRETTDESILRQRIPAAVGTRLLGPVGSNVSVRFRDGTAAVRDITFERRDPGGQVVRFGNLAPLRVFAEHRTERLPDGLTMGYLRFSAWFPPIVGPIAEAVEAFATADIVIVDIRGNPGGIGGLVMGVGGHFLTERIGLGTMRTRDTTLEFVVNPQTVANDGRRIQPLAQPLAILVDSRTGSTSEIFAGGMQAIGRAVIVGETTAGEALPALTSRLPSGDILMHAVADFEDPNGLRLEGVGVVPDVQVSLTREALLANEDPVLTEAIRFLTATLR